MGSTVDARATVKAFWEAEACGERYGDEQELTRYRLEPEIIEFADFPSAKGKDILEIGIGMGADFARWAANASNAVGVDITERAALLTKERLMARDLSGTTLVGDAESLPFRGESFDLVYSWGVLHHTPDTKRALEEVLRLLRPGGEAKVMLYHRRSWTALLAWIRFGLLRGRPWTSVRKAVAFIESPGTQAFIIDEISKLFSSFEIVEAKPRLTYWDRKRVPLLARMLGDRFGWFLLIQARKGV